MDPVKQITTPIAEVQRAATRDEYGEEWVVIDGIETKVPSVKAAKALLKYQDALRVKIREDLDAKGLRFNPDGTDREEQVEITLEDGTKTTVGLLKPGDANCFQIGKFSDAPGLLEAAEKAQAESDRFEIELEKERAASDERARLRARSPLEKVRDKITALLKGGSK